MSQILTLTEEPVENPPVRRPPSDTTLNIKESVQKFAQNYKKNTTSKDFQVDDSSKTRLTKDSGNIFSSHFTSLAFDKKAKPVLNIKKLPTTASLQKSIDESIKEMTQFERKKEPMLTDLSNLLEELEDKTNPLLRQTEERIDDIKGSISRLSQEHRDKMKTLTERIRNLREERVALAAKLEDKKKINLENSAEKERRHHEV